VSGWTKLFSSIVTSSIWCEDDPTLRVWIAMLALADADGVVEGSVPGFANLARVKVEQMRAAVDKLSAPDPDSRTPDHEGRRIEPIGGGWRILNYGQYREKAQEKEGSRAPYMRVYRQRQKNGVTAGVTKDVTRNTEARSKSKRKEPALASTEPARVPLRGARGADALWQTILTLDEARLSKTGDGVQQARFPCPACKEEGSEAHATRTPDGTLLLTCFQESATGGGRSDCTGPAIAKALGHRTRDLFPAA